MGRYLNDAIKFCLSKRCTLKAADIDAFISNIQAVFLGIKPSYLLDKFSCAPEKFSELIKIIFEDCNSVVDDNNFYGILSFQNGDLLLVNIQICIDNIKHSLEQLKCKTRDNSIPDAIATIIIDVTETLNHPEHYFSFSNTIQDKILHVYLFVLNMMTQFYETKIKHSNQTLHFVPIYRCCLPNNLSINLCTVYGILLNYPFVYWFDEEISQETCINMTELCVTKLSVPFSKYSKKSIAFSQTYFEMYAFSLPNSLVYSLTKVLQNWKSSMISKVESIFNDKYSMQEFCITVPCLSC